MIISNEDAAFCIEEARQITEQYKLYVLNSGGCKKSVDDLEWLITQYCNKVVRVQDLNLPAEELSVRGAYVAWADGSYDIFLLAELSDRERRFVKCKELFHVVMDQPHCRSMEIYRHVEATNASIALPESKPNQPVAWEWLAEIAAMEFLFPYSAREAVLEASNDAPDYPEIAAMYGVPQVMVELYLGETMMVELGKANAPPVLLSVVEGGL